MRGNGQFAFRIAAAAVAAFVMAAGTSFFPARAFAWGANGERLVVNRAIETLPPDIQPFFDSNRDVLGRLVVEPLELMRKNTVTERRNHYVYLDHYGKFPFDALPRNYKAAVAKFSKAKLEASGVLPWQIGVYSEKLTAAFREHDWEKARLAAAYLASYVAQSHDPFHTTENYDGHLSGQPGLDLRFSSGLVDRYSMFFPIRPNDAVPLHDATDHAFDACMSAHQWLENILLADRQAHAGLSDYSDEYYDRFYNLTGAIVIRQLSEAATDVGSYWLSAWINAGRPQLPPQ